MNFSQIRTRLRKLVGNPTATDVPDADLNEVINEAYQELCDEYRFRATRELATFSTAANVNAYALPTNSLVLMGVKDCTNDVRLRKRNHDWVMSQTSDTDSPGKPTNYARYEDYIKLFPTPDGVYSINIYYRIYIADLSADADIPVIPVPWHRGLIRFARYKYYDALGQIQMAQYTYRAWQVWLNNKPTEVDEEEFYEGAMTGVEVTTLGTASKALDFDHSD